MVYHRNIYIAITTHVVAFILGSFYNRLIANNVRCSDEWKYGNSHILQNNQSISYDKEELNSTVPTKIFDALPNISKILDISRSKIRTDLRNYVFNTSNASKLEDLVLEAGGQPLRSVIVSTWRSGSTFLGEVLNAMPGSFYEYEPLINNQNQPIRDPHNAELARNTIISILKCNYDNKRDLQEYFEYKKSHIYHPKRNTRLWEFCKHKKELCLDPNFVARFCKLFPFQSMKLVLIRLQLLDELLKDKTLNVKIVLLVRDPRAVMQSRRHQDFCTLVPDCWEPGLLCSDMVSDFMAAVRLQSQYPSRLTVVRYEDLALNPMRVSNKLYDFLGLNDKASLNKYIETHTTEDLGGNSFSTYRNSRNNAYKWKNLLDFDYVNTVQASCKQAMRLWGYRLAKNATHMQSKDFNPLGEYPIDFLSL